VPTTNIALDFPDDKTQQDFEIAFRGWLKQYQQQAGVSRALTGGAQQGSPQGSTGGLTGGTAGGHSYGKGASGGGEAGLLSIGGASGQVGPYGGSVKDFYLNFIPGW